MRPVRVGSGQADAAAMSTDRTGSGATEPDAGRGGEPSGGTELEPGTRGAAGAAIRG
ncbi:hypothetical protein [Arthrobacter sp. PAMC25284]|uniref:hypothetical protein n=1 Tax=Arthrobacter sp. PAMC25284 TaxID=2861279 RepID=UPI001C62FB19|nr:hypothetical protein [Arthrobacter sp. PAMC25284]QYF90823.1 hypothetical protein KY499_06155 [Arthrobacter sp. PAMC25284]